MTKATLYAAFAAAVSNLHASGAVFDEDVALEPYRTGGIPYPQPGADRLPCVSSNFPLVSLKGKKTVKWGHIQIWRHDSGRYEPNSYVL